MLIVSLDQYIVVVALPDIGRELGYSSQTLQSVISAYAVASSGFLLFGGRATDLLGRRRILVTGLALYAVASLAGGLARGPELQLTARAAQGLGGALVFPSTLALINTTFAEGRDRNRALGIWGGAGAAGLVVGVLLGGILTRAFGWEAVFFVNVPLAGAALILTFRLIEADQAKNRDRVFDLPGALSVTGAVTLLVFALVQGPNFGWDSPGIVGAAVAGLLLLGVFAAIERRSRDPLVPAQLLATGVLTLATVIAFMFMATFGSLLYFLSIYFQEVRGYDALETGIGFLLPYHYSRREFNTCWSVGDALRHQTHPCHCAHPRRNWRCRGGFSDVAGWVVHHAYPRPRRRQHRRRYRVHNHVHRRGHRSDRS